jgi:glutamine synthetase
VFIVESGSTRTLCIPSVFIGYNGEALDEMTPLLRSSDVLSEKAIELLELLGDKGVLRVYTTLGPEQEYFLIDRAILRCAPISSWRAARSSARRHRADSSSRITTSAASPSACRPASPKSSTSSTSSACRSSRGTTKSRRAVRDGADVRGDGHRVDHNQLVMTVLRRVALRHGLQALLHEKPFAGINGSGKHCNWSMAIAADDSPELDGTNLLKPGKTPHQNIRFLMFPRRGAARACTSTPACCAPASRRGTSTASAPTKRRRRSSRCSWARCSRA